MANVEGPRPFIGPANDSLGGLFRWATELSLLLNQRLRGLQPLPSGVRVRFDGEAVPAGWKAVEPGWIEKL